MKAVAAILCYLALVVVLSVVTPAEGKWIIRKVSSSVPALPTTNLLAHYVSDTEVWEATSDPAEDADPVVEWRDQSGNGNHLTATAGNEPTYRAGGGTPYVEFDGTEFMRHATAAVSGDAITIYAVCYGDVLTSSMFLVQLSDASSNNNLHALGVSSTPANGTPFIQNKDNAASTATAKTSTNIAATTIVLIHGSNNAADTSRSAWIANGSIGTESTAQALDHTVIDQIVVGSRYDGSTEASNWDGRVYEVVIYDEEHDASERADTIAYLQDKWGL